MIPFNTRMCEILEAIWANEPELKNVKMLNSGIFQLMRQTNNIYQRNLVL